MDSQANLMFPWKHAIVVHIIRPGIYHSLNVDFWRANKSVRLVNTVGCELGDYFSFRLFNIHPRITGYIKFEFVHYCMIYTLCLQFLQKCIIILKFSYSYIYGKKNCFYWGKAFVVFFLLLYKIRSLPLPHYIIYCKIY